MVVPVTGQHDYEHDQGHPRPAVPPTLTPILAGTIVALAMIFPGLLFGLAVTHKLDGTTTPMLTTILGFAGVLVSTFVNGRKTTQVERKLSNGFLDEKIKRNVAEALSTDRHEQEDQRATEGAPRTRSTDRQEE